MKIPLEKLKRLAEESQIDAVGFANDLRLQHADYFLSWLEKNKNGEMSWLGRNLDLRLNPARIEEKMPHAIVALQNYKNDTRKNSPIARYAWGDDYHIIFKKKLIEFANRIKTVLDPAHEFRVFVDTGPILERDLAVKAGLGWIGRNTCLINEDKGSFVFIGVILTNLTFEESTPVLDQCATCTLCLESCPTQALDEYQLDASKCLAYHNIEKRNERSSLYYEELADHLFGCDICQDVCPWNKKSPLSFLAIEKEFDWIHEPVNWLRLTASAYRKKLKKSALSRVRYLDFMRNIFLYLAQRATKEEKIGVQEWVLQNPRHKNLPEVRYFMEKQR